MLRARPGDAVPVNGALGLGERFEDLLIADVLRRVRPSTAIVVVDATWAPQSMPGEVHSPVTLRLFGGPGKALVRLASAPRTHICLLSRAEVNAFAQQTGTDPSLVHFTPYPASLKHAEDLARYVDRPGEGYVFADGDTMRGWGLVRAALAGSDLPVRIASRSERAP